MIFRYAVEGDSVRDVCAQAEKHLGTFGDVRAADYLFTHGSFEDEMAIRWYLAAYKAELLLEPELGAGYDFIKTLGPRRETTATNDLHSILERSSALLTEAHAIVRQFSVYLPALHNPPRSRRMPQPFTEVATGERHATPAATDQGE